jgi:beta-mannosidase
MTGTTLPINEGWEFKESGDDDASWLPVAQFPTNIHLDLLHHGKIPDPFKKLNELAVQWVGERVWMYRTRFDVPPFLSSEQQEDRLRVILAFEGLDTFATVRLNGTVILNADNMFVPRLVPVGDVVRVGARNNTLEITFESAWLVGKKLQERFPDHIWRCWNGDSSRLAVRKAQYHYVCMSLWEKEGKTRKKNFFFWISISLYYAAFSGCSLSNWNDLFLD